LLIFGWEIQSFFLKQWMINKFLLRLIVASQGSSADEAIWWREPASPNAGCFGVLVCFWCVQTGFEFGK
jgi:hypothetical protein